MAIRKRAVGTCRSARLVYGSTSQNILRRLRPERREGENKITNKNKNEQKKNQRLAELCGQGPKRVQDGVLRIFPGTRSRTKEFNSKK